MRKRSIFHLAGAMNLLLAACMVDTEEIFEEEDEDKEGERA